MITKGANEVAEVLLYGSCGEDHVPRWKKLPRPVKQQLMKKLGEKNYNNIHDPRLYQELDRRWSSRMKLKEQDIVEQAKLVAKVECSICLETYDGNDKVSTLMCGHKFCSTCIFQHIERLGGHACCPLCRRNVFHFDTCNEPSSSGGSGVLYMENALNRKRAKRQIERRIKRQRKREDKKKENL